MACAGRPFVDFSARRDHGLDAALGRGPAPRVVGGAAGTSLVEAGRRLRARRCRARWPTPYVMAHDHEVDAFRAYLRQYGRGVGPARRHLRHGRGHAPGGRRDARPKGWRPAASASTPATSPPSPPRRGPSSTTPGYPGVQILASGDLDEDPIAATGRRRRTRSTPSGSAPGWARAPTRRTSAWCTSWSNRAVQPRLKLSPGKHTSPGRKQVWRSDGRRPDRARRRDGRPGARPLLHPVVRRRPTGDRGTVRRGAASLCTARWRRGTAPRPTCGPARSSDALASRPGVVGAAVPGYDPGRARTHRCVRWHVRPPARRPPRHGGQRAPRAGSTECSSSSPTCRGRRKASATSATARTASPSSRRRCAPVPGLEASRIEIDRGGPSYTADTLAVLAPAPSRRRAVHDPRRGRRRQVADLGAPRRSGGPLHPCRRGAAGLAGPGCPADIDWVRVEVPHLEVSSTDLRARVVRRPSARLPPAPSRDRGHPRLAACTACPYERCAQRRLSRTSGRVRRPEDAVAQATRPYSLRLSPRARRDRHGPLLVFRAAHTINNSKAGRTTPSTGAPLSLLPNTPAGLLVIRGANGKVETMAVLRLGAVGARRHGRSSSRPAPRWRRRWEPRDAPRTRPTTSGGLAAETRRRGGLPRRHAGQSAAGRRGRARPR